MLPDTESSVQRVERELGGFIEANGLRWEREFTQRANGVVTMYLSGKISALLKDYLKRNSDLFLSANVGSMKVDASFRPSKAA